MSVDGEDPDGALDTAVVVRRQINRYALIYALMGAAFVYFGLSGNVKTPLPPWGLRALAIGGALLLLNAGGLVTRSRWALPLALAVHTAATIGVVVSLCTQLADATDSTNRSMLIFRHAGAVVAFVTSMLFWRRADVRAWLASKNEQPAEKRP